MIRTRGKRLSHDLSRASTMGYVRIGHLAIAVALFSAHAGAEGSSDAASSGGSMTKSAGPDETELADQPASRVNTLGALPTTGWEWGLELGIELPLGNADGGLSLLGREARSGELSGIGHFRVPITLDLGYRTSRSWWWGLEAGAGLGPAGDDCTDDVECEWSSLRLGAQTMYFFDETDAASPWIGATLGWEWLRGTVTQTVTLPGQGGQDSMLPVRVEEVLDGPHVSIQGGLPFELAEHLTIGPYVAGALGMYLTDEITCPEGLSCPGARGVDDKQVHAWLALGVRGSHGP